MLKDKFDPNDPLIQKNLPKVKELLFQENTVIYFVPSTYLREVLAQGKHPMVQGIVEWIKKALVEGRGIIIQKKLLWDLINKKLDEKNAFVFSNGDMRINWTSTSETVSGLVWDDKSIKNDLLQE